jgi:hypothetical protein
MQFEFDSLTSGTMFQFCFCVSGRMVRKLIERKRWELEQHGIQSTVDLIPPGAGRPAEARQMNYPYRA